MKLLFVGTDRDRAGGAAHFVALTRAMAGAGHDVTALVDRDGFIAGRLDQAGISWRHARFRNVLSPSAHACLARTIRQMRPDWLIGDFGKEYWPLLLQGRLHGIPVALFRQRAPAMNRLSEYLLPRLAQRFVAVSDYARTLFIERGMPGGRVQTLYNPVDTEVSRPDAERGQQLRRELELPEHAIVVGFVGRMYEGKGILVLQQALDRAMRQIPDLYALWIGDGPDLGRLRQAIAAGPWGARHRIAGWRADAAACYSAMSMLAFPTTMPETFGRVSIEAQASGIPVLGSRRGGIPETLRDGETGLLLPPGDVAAWAEGIIALCEPTRRRDMGAAARRHVEQTFSMPVVAAAFANLLRTAGAPQHTSRHPPTGGATTH